MEADNEHLTPLDVRLQDFERALRDRPDDLETLSAYGEASHLRGRLLEAMRTYQHLIALAPDAVQFRLALGKVYLDSGLYGEASGVILQALEVEPTSVEAHILLRRLARANGSVASDIRQPLESSKDFLPSPEALSQQRVALEREIGQLESEIADLNTRGADPAVEFSILLATGRAERLREALGEVEAWEARHRQIEEERQRLEEEERRRVEEEERRRQEEEAELRRREEEERHRREQEEQERLRAEEEQRLRREQEEAERLRLEQEEQLRREQEEEERRRREAEEAEAKRGTREREEAYARLGPTIGGITNAFMKTKGVSSVLIMARDGFLVHENHVQEVDVQKFSTFVVDALGALSAPGDGLGRWKVWVLEFPKGILVLHKITPDYFLVVYGQTGANFGLLTLLIDKNKGQLEGVLGEAPAVP